MKITTLAGAALGLCLGLRAEVITLPGPGGAPVADYQAAATPYKPYVAQLRSPAGVAVLLDAPKDHLHHHGLMFAVAVEGVTFWGETAASGRQVPRETRTEGSRLRQILDWTLPDRRVVVTEERTVAVQRETGWPATVLSWRTRLSTAASGGSVTLSGSHYYGLGLRLIPAMDKTGTFFNAARAEGESVRGSERLTNAAWCAYTAAVGGKPVTVAVFDHPANLRHPPRLFTMFAPFAYFGATLNLWKEPYTLAAGRPLDLRYGVAVWDGKPDHAAVEALYQRWLKLAP